MYSVVNALKVQKAIHYLFNTKAYCIFVQSSMKRVSLSPCDIVLYHSQITTKRSLA